MPDRSGWNNAPGARFIPAEEGGWTMPVGMYGSRSAQAVWVGRIFLLIGLIMLAIAIGVAVHMANWIAHAKTAPAEIVRVVYEVGSTDSDGSRSSGYRPIASFTPPGGNTPLLVPSRVRSNPSPYRVGDRVMVNYPPGHPEQAVIAGWLDRWFLPAIFGFLGVVFTIVGIVTSLLLRNGMMRTVTMRDGQGWDQPRG